MPQNKAFAAGRRRRIGSKRQRDSSTGKVWVSHSNCIEIIVGYLTSNARSAGASCVWGVGFEVVVDAELAHR